MKALRILRARLIFAGFGRMPTTGQMWVTLTRELSDFADACICAAMFARDRLVAKHGEPIVIQVRFKT